jgi:peptidyl-prolyl cis-trans isomerase SurA
MAGPAHSTLPSRTTLFLRAIGLGLLFFLAAIPPARAQSIVATVNGDPITTTDIDIRIKMLQIRKKPATREAAIEDIIADRLKFREAVKFGIDATNPDLQNEATHEASEANIAPAAYLAMLARSGLDRDQLKAHLRANAAWNNYVRALNKSVSVGESEIAAEMAKEDKKKQTADYIVRSVVLVLPLNAGGDIVQRRMREAEALRARFTECSTGTVLAKALPDVAIKEQVSRNASSLTTELRDTLDHTSVGHLTPPVRGGGGIEMLAVCEKRESGDETNLHDRIEENLLDQRLRKESERMYREVRARAVIDHR